MKHSPLFLFIGWILALFIILAPALPAQPASSYAYQPTSSQGYTPLTPRSKERPSLSNTKTTTSSKRTKTVSTSDEGTSADELPRKVAKVEANDQVQDSRIRKLEKDVSSIKGSSVRTTNDERSSGSSRAQTTYIVKPGDSLWGIANRHRVSPGEIIQLNRMKGDTVLIGQQLQIPDPLGSSSTLKTTYQALHHDVRPGDTSSAILKKYGITRTSLMEANPRTDFGAALVPGSRLVIPRKNHHVDTAPMPSTSNKSGSYTVRSGDSLKAIAIRHGTTTANLAALNGIQDANKLMVGQRLILPEGQASPVAETSPEPMPTAKPMPMPMAKPMPMLMATASKETASMPDNGLSDDSSPSVPPPSPAIALQTKPTASPVISTDVPAISNDLPAPPPESHRGMLAYRVDATDTIDSIASQFGTTPARIREINHLQPTTKLSVGDEIVVPALGAVAVGD
ncbi:MAG: LysM peptidoglycan-binding domain-containing protein [Prosthecobacter sp.]